MLVCHGPLWADDDTRLFCKGQTVASYERVLFVSGPHRNTSPTPNFQHGASPRARLSARLPTIAHVQNHAWGRRPPRLAVSATPSVRRFWRSGGGGAPLYDSRLHHPPLSGLELEGDDANLPRRRISEDSQRLNTMGGSSLCSVYSWMPSRPRDNPSSPLIQGTLQADISRCGIGGSRGEAAIPLSQLKRTARVPRY